MPDGLPRPDVIDITGSSDGSDFDDLELTRLEPRLLFSPRPYSEEPVVGNGNEDGSHSSLRDAAPAEDVLVQRRRACLDRILEVFPDICHKHIEQLYDNGLAEAEGGNDPSGGLILKILDSGAYPKEKDRKMDLKRKREEEVGNDEKEAAAWATMDRPSIATLGLGYYHQAKEILRDEFSSTPLHFIDETFRTTGKNLFAAYADLERAERTYESYPDPPYKKLKKPRRLADGVDRSSASWIRDITSHHVKIADNDIQEELQAARKKRIREDLKRSKEVDLAAAEAANEKEHRDRGMMVECQCCFDDLPFNRTTHCDGDEPHFFCLECAKRNANNEIGQSRHKLCCMDSSGCKAEFQREQIRRFLDGKTLKALDRIRQQDDIRLAELEDLAHCPFCDFAAICPPVDIDREFRCHNPECEKVSCRLCKQETHIPLSCEAYAKENKLSVRHAVEEAMTEALLRSCNKCKESYVKEFGCNKMVCPKCHSMQCYVCSKTIAASEGYNHFEQRGPVGQPNQSGKCLLHDNTEQRQQDDIQKAEQRALGKVRADNPDLTEEELKVKFSDVVKLDDGRRLAAAGQPWVMPHPVEPRLDGMGQPQLVPPLMPVPGMARFNARYMREMAAVPMPPLNLVHGGRVIPDDPNLIRAHQPPVPHLQPVVGMPQPPPYGHAVRNDAQAMLNPYLGLRQLRHQHQAEYLQAHDAQLRGQIEQQAQRDTRNAEYHAQTQNELRALRINAPLQSLQARVHSQTATRATNNARQQQSAAREGTVAAEALPFHPYLRDAEVLRQAQQQPLGQIDQAINHIYQEEDGYEDDFMYALLGPQ